MATQSDARLTDRERIAHALDGLQIELPSWGFANTGTRFGKYLQTAAAVTTAEKIADAGLVYATDGIVSDRRAACAVGCSVRPQGRR